jgi:hypothetical protein
VEFQFWATVQSVTGNLFSLPQNPYIKPARNKPDQEVNPEMELDKETKHGSNYGAQVENQESRQQESENLAGIPDDSSVESMLGTAEQQPSYSLGASDSSPSNSPESTPLSTLRQGSNTDSSLMSPQVGAALVSKFNSVLTSSDGGSPAATTALTDTPKSTIQAAAVTPDSGQARALQFEGFLSPKAPFNPELGATEDLAFPMADEFVSTKIVEQCHHVILEEVHQLERSSVVAGYKGIKDLDDPLSTSHFEADHSDASVWMLTLLLNEKPSSIQEMQARHEDLPTQTWVYGITCLVSKKYNKPLCDVLLSPANFAKLVSIIVKLAHIQPRQAVSNSKKGLQNQSH